MRIHNGRQPISNYAINPTPELFLRSNRTVLPARVIAALAFFGDPVNRFLAFAIALFVSVLGHAQEVNRLSVSHLALYQPDDVVRSRTGDFTEFTKYVKGVNVSVEEVLEKLEVANARTGAIVVVVRPNGRMRLWFAESSGELSTEQERVISDAIAKVPVCLVHNGPVAFAVAYSMGGKVPSGTAIPIPEEWRNAMPKDKAVYIPDEIMTEIWPDNGES